MIANYDINAFSFPKIKLILGGKYKIQIIYICGDRGENKNLTLLCYCVVVLCYAMLRLRFFYFSVSAFSYKHKIEKNPLNLNFLQSLISYLLI